MEPERDQHGEFEPWRVSSDRQYREMHRTLAEIGRILKDTIKMVNEMNAKMDRREENAERERMKLRDLYLEYGLTPPDYLRELPPTPPSVE